MDLNAFTTEPASEPRPSRLPVIVLAGGRSRRFGRDKLTVRLRGRTALSRVVVRVAPIASEVIVSTSSGSRQLELTRWLPPNVRFLLDRRDRWGGGPAGAMARALQNLGGGPVLFVPGDMPWLETRALRRFVERAETSAAEVAAPYWQSGETEHLVQWHRSRETLRYLPPPRANPPSGRRASEYLRSVPRTLLEPVAGLSDRPQSFSHLTYPSDIHRPSLRGEAGRSPLLRLVEGAPKRRYREAHVHMEAGRALDAARAFAAESRWYTNEHLSLLATHALDDAIRVAEDEPAVRSAGERGRQRVAVRATTRQRLIER